MFVVFKKPTLETLTLRKTSVRVLWYSSARMKTKMAQMAIFCPKVIRKKPRKTEMNTADIKTIKKLP